MQSLYKVSLTAAILAGGKSSRMNLPKCLVTLENGKIIDMIVSKVSDFEEMFIVTNFPELYFYAGIPILGDIYPFKGPMAGIHVALKNSKYDVFAFACDMPLIKKEIIYTLAENHIYAKKLITVPSYKGNIYPLPGIYSKKIFDEMEKLLRDDNLSLKRLLDDVEACVVDVANFDEEGLSFVNINTEEDLKKLKNLIERR